VSRSTTREAAARLAREIAQEKAAALGRAGERLQAALDEAGALAARLRAADDPTARAALVRQYEAVRTRASQARLALVVQREAIGLRQHRAVEQHFPEPPRLT